MENITLNINPETVRWIIMKVKEFSVKEAVTFPEKISQAEYGYDASQILADHIDDLTYREIIDTIKDLEPDQKIELIALLYIGRGDYSADDWQAACDEAENYFSSGLEHYLLSMPLLASYLEKGLEMLGYDVYPDQIL
ncbi:MAG: DUF3775 domain-containing protein [Gammaproteobacteria bacterium]|nr:DUF3775 domain-containing protein [Gammaproteobacteria bacterium]